MYQPMPVVAPTPYRHHAALASATGATHTNSSAILLRSKASSIVFIKLIMCATILGLTLLA